MIETTNRKKSPGGTDISKEQLNQMRQVFNNPQRTKQPTIRYSSTRGSRARARITPKERQLYSSLGQPNIFDASLTSSTINKPKRAKHNSVLNFSDGS